MAEHWQARIEAIRADLGSGEVLRAAVSLNQLLIDHPGELWILIAASDVYRNAGQDYTAYLYAERLMREHPQVSHGYCRGAQDLARMGRYEQAVAVMERGMELFPRDYWMLVVAGDLQRQLGRHEQALALARSLIANHPEQCSGFVRAVQDLNRLKRFGEARQQALSGLERYPDQPDLLILAHEAFSFSGLHEVSLELAQRLILADPALWQGYAKATQDLVALKRFDAALAMVRQGLSRARQCDQLQRLEAYAGRFVGLVPSHHPLESASRTALPVRDLIAYASVPGFFHDLQTLRSPSVAEASRQLVPKQILFVAGLGRSGTSALGKLLNISTSIELYTELYDPGRLNGYEPQDFLKPRLQATLAHHPQPGDAELFAARHQSSRWIGDKRPNFQFCLEATYDNFVPGHHCRTLVLQRDLRAVLRSTHQRAENPDDHSWSREHGMEHALLLHNASCWQLIDLHRRRPDVFASILFVRYEEVFTSLESAEHLFDALDVRLQPHEQQQLQAFITVSADRVNRRREADGLEARIEAILERYLDPEAQRLLAQITGGSGDAC